MRALRAFWPAATRLSKFLVMRPLDGEGTSQYQAMRRMRPRYYTPELANSALPLVSRITKDLRDTALEIRRAWEEVQAGGVSEAVRTEMTDRATLLQDRFMAYSEELDALGIELKDPFEGLIDFRALRGDDEVYLCWRLGEDGVCHWHELHTGFSGRQSIETF